MVSPGGGPLEAGSRWAASVEGYCHSLRALGSREAIAISVAQDEVVSSQSDGGAGVCGPQVCKERIEGCSAVDKVEWGDLQPTAKTIVGVSLLQLQE